MTIGPGEFFTERFAFEGGRSVTVYAPPRPPQAVVFAGDGQLIAQWGEFLNESIGVPPTLVVGVHRADDETVRLHEYSPGFDPARFAAHGLPVIADDLPGYPGPLAGILAGLDWLADNRPGTEWMLSAAADCPFLPHDLVARLHAARSGHNARIAVAASGGRRHPVVGLWPVDLRHDLRHALTVERRHAVGGFVARHDAAVANWPTVPLDPFFNANTAEDIAEAERLAALENR